MTVVGAQPFHLPPCHARGKAARGQEGLTHTEPVLLVRHQGGTLSTCFSCHAPTRRTPRRGCHLLLVTDREAETCPRHKAGKWQRQDLDLSPIWPQSPWCQPPDISTRLTMTLFPVQQWTPQPPPALLVSPHHRAIGPELGARARLPGSLYPARAPWVCWLPHPLPFVGKPGLQLL